MKPGLILGLTLALATSLAASWDTACGNLRRDHKANQPSTIQGPVREAWVGAGTCDMGSGAADPIVCNDKVVCLKDSGLQAWSRADGSSLWELPGMFEQPPAYDSQRDILYLVDNAGRLMGVDAESATILWATSGSPAYANATYADGQLFLTTAKSPIRLVSLDPDSQAVNLQLDLSATSQAVLPAYDAGGLYLSQVNGWVTAVDTVGQKVLWSKSTGGTQYGVPSLTDSLVIVQTMAGKFIAMNRADGSIVWTYQAASYGMGNVAVCNEMVIGTNDDRTVFGLNADNGALCWRTGVEGNFAAMSPLVVCGKVFVCGCTGRWYCLDGANGALLDTFDTYYGDSGLDYSESDGQLFACDWLGQLHCFVAKQPQDPARCACLLSCGMAIAPTAAPTPLATATPPCSSTALAQYSFDARSLASNAPKSYAPLTWTSSRCLSGKPDYLLDGVGYAASGFEGQPGVVEDARLDGDPTWLAGPGSSLQFAFQLVCDNWLENTLVDWSYNGAALQISAFGDQGTVTQALRIKWTTANGWQEARLAVDLGCGPVASINPQGQPKSSRPGRDLITLSRTYSDLLMTLQVAGQSTTWVLPGLASLPGMSGIVAPGPMPSFLSFGNRHAFCAPLAGYIDAVTVLSCSGPLPTPTVSPNWTATATMFVTPAPTGTPTRTVTATMTMTTTQTATPDWSPTFAATVSISPVPAWGTLTPTFTCSASPTDVGSTTPSQTTSLTPTITLTQTGSPTFSCTPTLSAMPTLACPCNGRAVLATGGNVMLNAASRVDGDVQAAGSVTLQQGSVLNGGVVQNSIPSVTPVPEAADAVEEGTLLVAAGATLVLPAGDYHASSLTVQLGGTLLAEGAVKIWVDGAVVLGGQVMPDSGKSNDLWIIATGSQDFHINSQAQVMAVVDAPLANAVVDSQLVGCLTAKSATINSNGKVAKDLSLGVSSAEAAAPTLVPVDEEGGTAKIGKVLAMPNPMLSKGNQSIYVQMLNDADSLEFCIYGKAMAEVAKWQASGMRGPWISVPVPAKMNLPNGTYMLLVRARKGNSSCGKAVPLVVLR